MTKLEKENRHQLYVFIKKQQLTRRNARQYRLLSTYKDITYLLLFWLKSIPCAGNELAGDDVENCENSPSTLTNLSHLS